MAGRAVLRRRVVPAVLIALAAALGSLVPAQQAALAAALAVSTISAGGGYSCAIESGKAVCWGDNSVGELGDDSTAESAIPVPVDASGVLAGKTLIRIAAGDSHTCALDSAGAAFCWGTDNNGQLGNGNTAAFSSVPVAVDSSGALAGKRLTQIAVGNVYTCALDSAGIAYCWGLNATGELGNGSTAAHSSVPVAVDTSGALAGKRLTQITAAEFHTCALDSAGAGYCWGGGDFGDLGNGSMLASFVPVAVDASGALAGRALTQIAAAGEYHTCALTSSGAAFCWGLNDLGQLGDGSTADSSVPVAVNSGGVLAGKTLRQIGAARGYHTCAVDTSGDAYCWGDDTEGQLGDGSTTNSSVPVAVDTRGALAGKHLTSVTGGYFHTCAMDTVGAAYCWGDSSVGQLGDDSIGASDVPVVVGRDAPAGVTAVTGNDAATVSWKAPAGPAGGTLTGYTATAAPGGKTCATTDGTTCIIAGLTDGTTYSVTVVAHTTAGDSGASTPATVTVTHGPSGPIVSGTQPTKCIDDNGDSSLNDTKAVMWDCNGSAEQSWTVEGDGSIQINHKCIDVYRDEKTNMAPVELWTCTGGANQQWKAVNGTLVNPVSGKCLDDPMFNVADGTQLEIYTCDGGADQQWKLP
jgi:alpha-tubulin suppressor-like RCC1 family protein